MDKETKYKRLAKLMAFMLFLSAISASMMSYVMVKTFVTGEFPFGIIPLSEKKKAEEEAKMKKEERLTKEAIEKARVKGQGALGRINEEFVRELYDKLLQEQEKLANERADIAREKETLQEIKAQAQNMQDELNKKKEKIKKLLVYIDKKEVDNLKQIVKTIESLPIEQAVDMFTSYGDDICARILYYMNPTKSKLIISTILENGAANQKTFAEVRNRVRVITEKWHNLSEEIDYE